MANSDIISRLQNEINERKKIITGINRKLNRLKPVKNVLTNQKSAFNTVKTQTDKCIGDDYTWAGSTYSSFISKGEDLNDQNEHFYKHQLDRLLDELNNEITSLENEKARQFGIIGEIGARINSLANAVENFFN